jgi:hypothetical protein
VKHLDTKKANLVFFEQITDKEASLILAQDELSTLKLLDTETLDVIKANTHALNPNQVVSA